MIPENVNERFEKLGVLLLLDSPEGLEFGIDNISWKVGSKFKGVKMIPLGAHIIAYTLKSQNYMFKISQFLIFRQQQKILVYRWNEEVSQFLEVRGEQAEGYRQGVKDFHFDSYLGPYPNQNLAFWSQTTKYITKAVLDKLDPIDKIQQFKQEYGSTAIRQQANLNGLTLDGDEQDEQQMRQQQQQQQVVGGKIENPGKFKVLSDTIYYSDIPRYLNSNPSQITQLNMDKTPILKRVLTRQWRNKQEHFLGELQYSFVHFIIGEGEESLCQWKKIVDLLVNSESAYYRIQQQTSQVNLQKLVMDFIPVFYDQLNQFPPDFFMDQLTKTSFIVPIIKRLHQYSRKDDYSPKIKKRIVKLLQLIGSKFNYYVDSGDEDEEDKPILVDQQSSYF